MPGSFNFPGGSDSKSVCLQFRRPKFIPWMGKIPWRRKWQPTLLLLPGKSHGWRSLVGYSPWGHKELEMTERLHFIFTSWSLKIFPRTGVCWFPAHSSHFGINTIRGPCLDPLKEAGSLLRYFNYMPNLLKWWSRLSCPGVLTPSWQRVLRSHFSNCQMNISSIINLTFQTVERSNMERREVGWKVCEWSFNCLKGQKFG